MNVFELSLISTPVAGALAGGSAAGIAGAGAGLAIGLALYGMLAGLFALLLRKQDANPERPRGPTLVQIAMLLALCALPAVSWKLTALAVTLAP